jgi:hypothetical protein
MRMKQLGDFSIEWKSVSVPKKGNDKYDSKALPEGR